MNVDMDMDMSNDEVDLSAIILHNAATDTLPAFLVSSPIQSTIAAFPPVAPRPISKRRGKKRSSRACTTCRLRKVRCNIVAHGAPCSNCRHDEIECVLPLSRRQRYVPSVPFKMNFLLQDGFGNDIGADDDGIEQSSSRKSRAKRPQLNRRLRSPVATHRREMYLSLRAHPTLSLSTTFGSWTPWNEYLRACPL
jgi:hypothetical protein